MIGTLPAISVRHSVIAYGAIARCPTRGRRPHAAMTCAGSSGCEQPWPARQTALRSTLYQIVCVFSVLIASINMAACPNWACRSGTLDLRGPLLGILLRPAQGPSARRQRGSKGSRLAAVVLVQLVLALLNLVVELLLSLVELCCSSGLRLTGGRTLDVSHIIVVALLVRHGHATQCLANKLYAHAGVANPLRVHQQKVCPVQADVVQVNILNLFLSNLMSNAPLRNSLEVFHLPTRLSFAVSNTPGSLSRTCDWTM